jgi:formylglycine-generating enzyme required for sulfatase activity
MDANRHELERGFPCKLRVLSLLILFMLEATAAWNAAAQQQTNSSGTGSVGFWFQLSNGDRFRGKLLTEPLKVAATTGETAVVSSELTCLTRANTGFVTVSLKNGEVIMGKLGTEGILVQLDLGPQVSIPGANIVSILKGVESSVADGVARDAQKGALERMIWIPAGEFVMGSPPTETGRDPDEGPQTRVVITKGFWMGKCEVTQGEYQSLMGSNPSTSTEEPARPVDKVNWYEAVEYCKKLTQTEETAGRLPAGYGYRLPTEAEWEYACRAGSKTRFCYGDDKNETQLGDYAWFARNGESMTHPVGTRRPNDWGLQDMHGNVWEWCLDRWEGKLPGGTITNAPVFSQGNLRTARGGSWLYEPKSCRSANRDDYGPANRCSDVGFRLVLAPLEN